MKTRWISIANIASGTLIISPVTGFQVSIGIFFICMGFLYAVVAFFDKEL